MNRTKLQQHLARKIAICITSGALVWAYLLIRGALALRDQTGATRYDIHFGPLPLNHLTKEILGEGYIVGFSFEPGMIWYLSICCLIGLLWGWIAYHRQIR